MKRRSIVLLIFLAPLILCQSITASSTPKSVLIRSDLWARLNQERHIRKLPNLKWNGRLSDYGAQWSKKMSTKGFKHSGFIGLPGAETIYNYLGENIATGSAGVTAGTLHLGLMSSQDHRDNILSPGFTQAGIGVYCSKGKMWLTFEFARRWVDGPIPNYKGGTSKLPLARPDAGTLTC